MPELLQLVNAETWRELTDAQAEARRRGERILYHYVASQDGIKAEVFSNEHPPPHFRLKRHGQVANYSIADCQRLNGDLRLPERAVRKWWAKHRMAIALAWNEYRPSDCTVGPINVAALGW